MVLELTFFKSIQIVMTFIMTFALGMKFRVSDKARDIASIVWAVSLVFIWIFNV